MGEAACSAGERTEWSKTEHLPPPVRIRRRLGKWPHSLALGDRSRAGIPPASARAIRCNVVTTRWLAARAATERPHDVVRAALHSLVFVALCPALERRQRLQR